MMRKELYKKICERLSSLYVNQDGVPAVVRNMDAPDGWYRLIRHIDLWNHNVEFIEQEEHWERPAVFVEFSPIAWHSLVPGGSYRAEPLVHLHVVTDWQGSCSAGSELQASSLEVFDLLDTIHKALSCLEGETFMAFDLVESRTCHNHEDLLEMIETYGCVAMKSLR